MTDVCYAVYGKSVMLNNGSQITTHYVLNLAICLWLVGRAPVCCCWCDVALLGDCSDESIRQHPRHTHTGRLRIQIR